MVYSSKKPYQKPSKRSTRFLSQGIGPESVFEKPYAQGEYTEMNQAPNTPGVPPPVRGSGELKCLYDPNECEITIGCYAGPGIKIIGGPEESGAGYLTPEIIEGAIASWAVQSDVRAIEIIVDPSMTQNIVRVVFVDGWGKEYEELVDVDCFSYPYTVYAVETIYPGVRAAYDSNKNCLALVLNSVRRNLYLFTGKANSWIRSEIDSTLLAYFKYGGWSIAVDSNDKAHISYIKWNSGSSQYNLIYATNLSGSWVITDSGESPGTDNFTDIVIDSNDKPHIVFSYKDHIRYGTNASGSWVWEDSLANPADTGAITFLRIAIKSDDTIVHTYYWGGSIYTITGTAGSWTKEVAEASSTNELMIEIDSNDNVYIFSIATDLFQITNASGSWVKSTLVNDASDSSFRSLDSYIDSSNNFHLVHSKVISVGEFDQQYTTNISGSWITRTLQESIQVPKPAILYDSSIGLPEVLYRDPISGYLTYLIK